MLGTFPRGVVPRDAGALVGVSRSLSDAPCYVCDLRAKWTSLQGAVDEEVEPDDEFVHGFFDDHRYAVAEEAAADLAKDAFVEGGRSFGSVDLEDGGEHGGAFGMAGCRASVLL